MAGARATPKQSKPRSSSPAPHTEVVVPPDWASSILTFACHPTPPVVAVCGPKDRGKSTFSSVLLNALLPRHGKIGYLAAGVPLVPYHRTKLLQIC